MHPLDVKNGLPYVPMRPYTDDEWENLPHVVWTSDMEWDPTVLDTTISDSKTWFDAISDMSELLISSPFDEYGDYKHREADLHCFDVGEMPTVEDDLSVFHLVFETINFDLASSFYSRPLSIYCPCKPFPLLPC